MIKIKSHARTLNQIKEESFQQRVIRRISKISNSKRLIEESKKFSAMILRGLAEDFRKINNSSFLQERARRKRGGGGGGKTIDLSSTMAALGKIKEPKVSDILSRELESLLKINGVNVPKGAIKSGGSAVVKAEIKIKDKAEGEGGAKTAAPIPAKGGEPAGGGEAAKPAPAALAAPTPVKGGEAAKPAPGDPGSEFKTVEGGEPATANIAGPLKQVVPRSGGAAENKAPENNFLAFKPSNLPADTKKPVDTEVADSLSALHDIERERVAAAPAAPAAPTPVAAAAAAAAPAPALAAGGVTKVNQKINTLPAAAAAVPPNPRSMGQYNIPKKTITESLKRKYRLGLITLREYNMKKQQLDNFILKEEIKRQVKSLIKK